MKRWQRNSRIVMLCLLGGTAAVFAGFIASFAVHRIATPVPDLKEWFDIGGEANLPTWWNSLLLALVAALSLIAAWLASVAPAERRAWYVVAIAATYLSLDEATELHERLGGVTDRMGIHTSTYAWLVPGTLAAAIGVVVLVATGRSLPTVAARRLACALALYALGALGLEALGGVIRDRWDDSWLFTLAITAEEALEMLACVLAVGTVVDHLNPRRAGAALVVGISPS